ncbi:MAG: Gfo/Idh/MocA family oxidoreductase [Pseudomonadota bacterium]
METRIPGVAVIGTGYWGKNLVRNFSQLGALKKIYDSKPVTLAKMLAEYPGVEGSDSLEDIWSDKEIEGVVVAAPAEAHAKLVRASLLAGKDVLVEKPLCLSPREGEELVALALEKQRVLMVGHLLWHHPAIKKLKELMDEGALGRIQYIYSNRLNIGKLRREENVLWSFAPHDISLILGLLEEMPELVQAQGGNYLHQNIADVTVSTLSFPSGVKSHLFVSWLHPFKEQKLVVVGQDKMAVFDDTAPWESKLLLFPHWIEWPGNIPVAHKAAPEPVPLREAEPLNEECRRFLESILDRKTPLTDGNEALRVLRVLDACQRALEEKETIRLTPPKTPAANREQFFVHETALADKGVKIGAGCKIWHFSHIMTGSELGGNCNVGQNVVIGPRVKIGSGCKIQNNVSVYEGVTLEEDVFCGPSMVFTNVFNPRSHIRRMDELRPTLVKKGATIGANATIVCGHVLGEYCFVGAGAVVTADVQPYALVVGNPARRIGWVCSCGVKLADDLVCPKCSIRYVQEDELLKQAV